MSKFTAGKLHTELSSAGCHPSQVSVKGGIYTVRFGFFYRHGGTSAGKAEQVANALKLRGVNAVVVDHGEKDFAFNGGASVAKSSHWWVKVKLAEAAK